MRKNIKGSAMVFVVLFVAIALVGTLAFFSRSKNILTLFRAHMESIDARYQVETAYETAKSKIQRAASGMVLDTRLAAVNGNANFIATGPTFSNINNLYSANPSLFLQHMVVAQSYNAATLVQNANDEFATFGSSNSGAFPTGWVDPNYSDSNYYELKYTFTPLRVETQITTDPKSITFQYEYRLQMRGYGDGSFAGAQSEDAGVLEIQVRGRPFSQYALFMNSMQNQNGSTLYFAGGNTSAQAQEVYGGPVHVNGRPNFYGHPTFLGLFTSTSSELPFGSDPGWNFVSTSNYTGCPSQCPNFTGKQGGVPAISLPSSLFNTQRLAAGDLSDTASTNTNQPTNSEMISFLREYAGGTISGTPTSVPGGIYVPINNQAAKIPRGGIYVEGDATVSMDVVQGSGDFVSSQWSYIQSGDQSCKFQKFSIQANSSGNPRRDIYVADDPCNTTYVFDPTTTNAPVILNGRINGNLHVNGNITSLGGASRTRPAVARDFAFTVSALKDVKITNDLQYEDAEYVSIDASGNMGSTVIATPRGPSSGSTTQPTSPDIAAKISNSSSTVLGIISYYRNVLIAQTAPDNINLHGAIFAGNANGLSGGLGCGSTTNAATRGCGFGVENYSSLGNKGYIKFLGGISEYKDQTTGSISGSTFRGYGSRYIYDLRLLQTLNPPAFPISDSPQAFATLKPYRTWRISQAGP